MHGSAVAHYNPVRHFQSSYRVSEGRVTGTDRLGAAGSTRQEESITAISLSLSFHNSQSKGYSEDAQSDFTLFLIPLSKRD